MVGTPSSNSWVACVLEIHEYKVFAKLRRWKKKICVQVQFCFSWQEKWVGVSLSCGSNLCVIAIA